MPSLQPIRHLAAHRIKHLFGNSVLEPKRPQLDKCLIILSLRSGKEIPQRPFGLGRRGRLGSEYGHTKGFDTARAKAFIFFDCGART